jgi:hypothetical protein
VILYEAGSFLLWVFENQGAVWRFLVETFRQLEE